MLNEQQNDFREFKTELVTVVEALSVLQDFVESVFGTKYQSFIACNGGGGDQTAGPKNIDTENPLTALKRLRWKHSKNREGSTDERISSSSPSADGDKESRVDNGYSSSGGAVLEEERRNSSSSSLSNQMSMSSPTTTPGMTGYPVKIEQKEDDDQFESTFSVSVGRPEVVSIKCEQLDDTDFLDDVDPFGTETGSYHYEGEDSEITIENCYALSSMPVSHTSTEDSRRPPPQYNSLTTNPSTMHPHNPPLSRFIPELIPIQSDPLTQAPDRTTFPPPPPSILLKEEEEESRSSSSENSDDDGEWRPSSSLSIYNNSTFTKKSKPKRNTSASSTISAAAAPNRFSLPSLNFNPTFTLSPSGTAARQFVSQKSQLSTNGPTFKCDMCPATYKQEDSLRSHQKYKHNPSRVQCTCHLCGKSMVDKYRLQRHLRLHTGEKPFECQYCGQSFYRKDYHTKHLQRKHGISYNPPISSANAKAQFSKKPKIEPPISSVSSSSSSSISTATFKSYLSNVFETPSPSPTQLTSSMIHHTPVSSPQTHHHQASQQQQRHNFAPTSSVESTASTKISDMSHHANYNESIDNLGCNPHPLDYGGGGEYGAMGNIMSMTSLTFEDLISADL